MQQSRNGVLTLEINSFQFEKLKPFLDPTQANFQIKLFFSSKAVFESFQAELKENQIKTLSSESNFPLSLKPEKNILDPNLSSSFCNNESEFEFLNEIDINEEEEEEEGKQEINIIERTMDEIEEIKLLYVRMKKKDEIIEDFSEDPTFEINFPTKTSITIKGDRKSVLKAERELRRLLISLVSKPFVKSFKSEDNLKNFLLLDYVQEFFMDYGIKTLEVAPKSIKSNNSNDFLVFFFIEDKERSNDLDKAIEKIISYKTHSVNLNDIINKTLNKEEKLIKKKIYHIKYDYIIKYLENDLKEKATAISLKLIEFSFENYQIIMKIEGETENLSLFKNDLILYLTYLKTSIKTAQYSISKFFYYNEIKPKLEFFEAQILQEENKKNTFPLILNKKYNENEEKPVVIMIGYLKTPEISQTFNDFGERVQKTLNYTERKLAIESQDLHKALKTAEKIKTLEENFQVSLKYNLKTKILSIIGNLEQITDLESHIKEEEFESKREKIIYYFSDPLIFLIFTKYDYPSFQTTLKNTGLIIESLQLRKETNTFEFLSHPSHQEKILGILEEKKEMIKKHIKTQVFDYSGKSRYDLLRNPGFLRDLINYNSKEQRGLLPIELITSQERLIHLKKIFNPKSNKNNSSCDYLYKELLEIHLYDSIFPEEIELKAIIININVKGDYTDAHSQKIAESSTTNRFVAKEINKLNDNSMNKKKRAEVFNIVECRNPSMSYKITKMFYSIIKNSKIINNHNINQEIYSFCLDKNKNIYKDLKKFTYQRNLEIIFSRVLDDKLNDSLGIIVPEENELDVLLDYLDSFCKNSSDFSNLKHIHIFTNNNNETTYLNNKLKQLFTIQNDGTTIKTSDNILQEDKKIIRLQWKYLTNSNREEYFTDLENKNINLAYLKQISEFYLIKKSKQSINSSEIYLNVKENKATDLSRYKSIDFNSFINTNFHLKTMVQNYKQIGISNFTFYEDNSIFYKLDFKSKTVELFSMSYDKYQLTYEETKEDESSFIEEYKENPNKTLYCGVTGYQADIDEAILLIKQEFEKEEVEDEFLFPKNVDQDKIKQIFYDIKGKYTLKLNLDLENHKIQLKGVKKEIDEAKSNLVTGLYEEIEKIAENIETVKFPKEWVFPQPNYYKKYKLSIKDKEYVMVKKLFVNSMDPSIKILNIKRIQNVSLFTLYFHASSHMRKHKTMINEKLLFHGTSKINPKVIYKGKDVGFDMRLANKGLWGEAIYFTEDAKYVNNNYCFEEKMEDGRIKKKMIVALVLLGESKILPFGQETRLLKRPPLKDEKNQTELYDSVEGVALNSKLFMIYDNNKAYPLYVIDYI